MPPTILGPQHEMSDIARQAAAALDAGGLVVFPTETVYGIAASAGSAAGLAALREFKQRQDAQPFTIHMPGPASAERYVPSPSVQFRRLLRKTMPGPLTVIAHVDQAGMAAKVEAMLDQGLLPDLANQPRQEAIAQGQRRLYHEGTVGLRAPADDLATAVLGAVQAPVVASSANRRGEPAPVDARQAAQTVGDAAALIVDGGPCRIAKASTIVRYREGPAGPELAIEREGAFDERYLRTLLRWTLLLVCTGNTCRSPMAAGLARDMIAKRRGVPVERLEEAGFRVLSAGVSAAVGEPASPHAVTTMAAQGVDIGGHRSTALTYAMIQEADMVFCMSRRHRDAVLRAAPAAAERVFTLDPEGDIADPYGGAAPDYRHAAEHIRRMLERRLGEALGR